MKNIEKSATSISTGARNYAPDVKRLCWALLVTAVLYMLTGPHFGHANFIAATVFAGLIIHLIKTSDDERVVEREKAAASWLVVVFMVINAFYIIYGEHHPHLGFPDGPLLWLGNRFLNLFGLAFFMPAIVEGAMQNKKIGKAVRGVSIFIAAACMYAAWYLAPYEKHYPHQHEQHASVEAPAGGHKAEPWYSTESVTDDILMSVAVGLWLSVFAVEMRIKPENGKHTANETEYIEAA
jgi:hypothetical protein